MDFHPLLCEQKKGKEASFDLSVRPTVFPPIPIMIKWGRSGAAWVRVRAGLMRAHCVCARFCFRSFEQERNQRIRQSNLKIHLYLVTTQPIFGLKK